MSSDRRKTWAAVRVHTLIPLAGPPSNAHTIPHDAYGALREPNYRAFATGWSLASLGLQMQATALAWEVYERTNDAFALGLVALARALPVILLALPAGQMIDLLDRRKILIATQIAYTIASVALAIGSAMNLTIGWIYVLVALTGCARVFNGPARASLLPQIVRPERFQNAVTWNTGFFQCTAVVGPLAAGAMIWASAKLGMGVDEMGIARGVAWPVYAFAAATCLVLAASALAIRPYADLIVRDATRASISVLDAIRPSILIPGMLEGVRHIWREKTVLGAITLDLMAVLLGGATALMPVYAKDILHVGPIGLGILRASPFVGALITSLILAHRRPFENAGRSLLLCIAGFGACTIGFGFSTSVWLSVALLLALGALDGVSVVIRHVLVSVRTPDYLRGRVNAVNSVFIESSNELGGFESGLVAKLLGPVFSVVSGGVGTLVVVLLVAWRLPELRGLKRLDTPKPAVEEAIEEKDAVKSSL